MTGRFRFGTFELDARRGVLLRDGSAVALGNRAFSVLHALISADGRVVTKAELLAAAWPGTVVEEGNLSVQIAALRKVLGTPPGGKEWITTASRIGYRFSRPVTIARESDPPVGDPAGKPSIAVLPFANLSGDPAQEYFVDGITEDILNTLSRFRWFFVIARNATFALKGKTAGVNEAATRLGARYVLEGSVRKSARRIRIAVALTDVASAKQIWANRYEFAAADIFAVQDQIAHQVTGAIEPELLRSESKLAAVTTAAGNFSAWDLVRQGTYCFHKVARESHLRARELFREATRREPELPEAHIWLARVSAGIVAYGWSADPQADLREGLAAAFEAIRRDEQSPYSHYALAINSVYVGESAQAIRAAARALELNPGFALGHLVLGMARLYAGQPADAIAPLEVGLKLNAYDPQNFAWYNLLALARYFTGHCETALQAAERASDIRPNWRPTLQLMACCELALGRTRRAAQFLDQVARLPEPGDNFLGPLKAQTRLWQEMIEEKLLAAG